MANRNLPGEPSRVVFTLSECESLLKKPEASPFLVDFFTMNRQHAAAPWRPRLAAVEYLLDDGSTAGGIDLIGLNERIVARSAQAIALEGPAWSGYAELIHQFSVIVGRMSDELFEGQLSALKRVRGLVNDIELTDDDWKEVVHRYAALFEQHVGAPFPQSRTIQLRLAFTAMAGDWLGAESTGMVMQRTICGISVRHMTLTPSEPSTEKHSAQIDSTAPEAIDRSAAIVTRCVSNPEA